MLSKNINKQINYYWISKYNNINLKNFPEIDFINYSIVLLYKQKNKYYLFINMILFLIFFNPNTKTRFLFKTTQINILELHLKSKILILKFLNNFIFIYFPLIDSFSTEFKFIMKKNTIIFSFFKFPLLFELNSLFNSIEYLYTFLNNYKSQLQISFKKQRNNMSNYSLLQFYKLPLLIK